MTVHQLVPVVRSTRLRTTGDLVDALGVPFSDPQLAAITAPLEPGVIIAGAGSGKTTVMAARVVWLVGIGAVRPEEVLGLTFTRKAAAELSSRVRQALLRAGVVADSGVDESGEQLIMTYDAFAARLVAEHGLRLGFEADPTMLTGATRYRLAARVVKAAAGPFEFISRLRPATVTERVLRLDADLQQHLVDPTELDKHTRDLLVALESAPRNNRGRTYADVARAMVVAQERLELASLVQEYQALKLRLGLVEFADQMAIAARLAVQAPPVSATLRSTFAVVLLDEYQDTSAAQAMMLRGLFSGSTPSEGLGHPVTAVGDPLQAIYGWRGAAASNILTFAETFRRRDGRPAAELRPHRQPAQRPIHPGRGQPAQPAVARALQPGPRGVGRLEPPAGAPTGQIRAATFETWAEEVTWIAEQVLAVRSAGPAGRWADIAVLTRRNADIAPLYAELSAREVPVEIVGLGGLLHLPEVMDVTATLRLVDDVTANPELVRLLTGPRWRIGPRDLALLGRRAQQLARDGGSTREPAGARSGPDPVIDALEHAVADLDPTDVVSLLDALEDPGDEPYSAAARERFGRLAAELAYLRRHVDEPVLDLARRVIATLGLDIELLANPEFARTSRRDQLGAFLDAVAAYVDVDGEASLTGLLAYLQAEIEQGAGLDQAVPSDREAVKLLTVHKAKGLEWQVVFLPALMQGTFPSDRVTDNWVTNPAVLPADLRGDADSFPQLAEASNSAIGQYRSRLAEQQLLAEHRLAYVAATRAKQLLVGSGHSWRSDLVRARTPSAYLTDDPRGRPSARPAAGRGGPARSPEPVGGRRGAASLAAAAGSGRAPPAGGGRRIGGQGPGPVRRVRGLRGPGGSAAAAGRRGAAGRLGRRPGTAAGRGPCGPVGRPARTAAGPAVHHRGHAAPGRSTGVCRRAGPADATAAVPRRPLRYPFPPLGGALLRPRPADGRAGAATAGRPRRPARPGGRGRPRRAGAPGAVRGVRGRTVRPDGAVRARGAVQRGPGRAAGPRPDRCRLRRHRERVHLPGGGLEDQPERVGRPAAAGDLPAGLGRGQPASAGGGRRGVLLRPLRPSRPTARAAYPPCPRATAGRR